MMAACALFAATAVAQDYEKNILGVRAGLNLSRINMDPSLGQTMKPGFHVGISEQFRIAANAPLYLETGLYYSLKGTKRTDYYNYSEYTVTSETKSNASYLQIPLMLNYQFHVGRNATIQPAVGIYYALGVGGKAKTTWEYADEKETEKINLFKKTTFRDEDGDYEEVPQQLKRSDFGLRFQLAATVGRFYVGAGYDLGLTKINKFKDEDIKSAKTGNMTVTVGWNF